MAYSKQEWTDGSGGGTPLSATRLDYMEEGIRAAAAAADGKAPASHTHPIADLTATGTRSSSTFLRGDGTWAIPPGDGSGGGTGGAWVVVAGDQLDTARPDTTGPVVWYATGDPVNADATQDVTNYVSADGTSGGDGTSYVSWVDAPSGVAATDTAVIKGALADAADAGGGAVLLRRGQYEINATLVIDSGVTLLGAGHAATVLHLADGANCDVIQSADYATLTGTNNGEASPTSFTIRDLSIDGNRAANTTGHGIRLYACDFILRDLRIYSCAENGLTSEWADITPPGVNNAMECELHNIKAHSNTGWGFDIAGPHDGFAQLCVAYNNDLGGIRAHGNSHGFLFRTCHSWGFQPIAVSIEQMGVRWDVSDAESTNEAGPIILVLASDCSIFGGKVWSPSTTAGAVGIQLGDATRPVENTTIDVLVAGTPGGAVNFSNSNGRNWARLTGYIASGVVFAGTPHATDVVDMPAAGGVQPDWAGVGGGELVRNVTAANYIRHRTKLPDPGATPGWYKLGTWTATASGSRLSIETVGSSGYDADTRTVGKVHINATIGDGQFPNIGGYYRTEGEGVPAILFVKAVAAAGGNGRSWAIWAQIANYVGNSHISVEVGNDTHPSIWTWELTPGSDPGGTSGTVAVFDYRHQIGDYVAATTPGTIIGRMPVRDNYGGIVGYVPVYDVIT